MSLQLQQAMMWMDQVMQQRGLIQPTVAKPTPTITPSLAPTPMFIPEIENHELVTTTYGTRRRRRNEACKEIPARCRSHAVRNLIEEDIDMSKSTTLGEYETKI